MSDPVFTAYLADLRAKLNEIDGFSIAGEKDVNYGHQFILAHGSDKLHLTVYNGKKGRRLVWTGSSEWTEFLQAALAVSEREQQKRRQGHAAQAPQCSPADAMSFCTPAGAGSRAAVWAGSDESGKGDFFGPLVVAAVVADEQAALNMQLRGVRDCKALSDKKILELEKVIMDEALDYSVLELKPRFYNLRYEQIKKQRGNLNNLLGSGHINALSQVLERQKRCGSALIDQFMRSDALLKELHERFPDVSVMQQPKAEANMAVAAASVLARARFLRSMAALSAQAGEQLPKGGGAQATAAARRLAQRQGREALRDYVKLHFANMKDIK